MLNAQVKVKEINKHCSEHKEIPIENKENQQDGPQIMGEAAAANE